MTAPAPTPTSTAVIAEPTAESGSSTSYLWLWILLAVLAVGTLIGFLVAASKRRAKKRAEEEALVAETLSTVGQSLTQVLATVDARSRSAAWPPVDSQLSALQGRWKTVADGYSGDDKRRPEEVGRLLTDLVIAVRAENDAVLQGLDWTLLRPRVDQDRAALDSLLAPPAPPPTP